MGPKYKVGDVVEFKDKYSGAHGTAEILENDRDSVYTYSVEDIAAYNSVDGTEDARSKVGGLRLLEISEIIGPVAPEAAPPADPKAKFGATKPNYALIPGTALAHMALAMEDGAMKYGPSNWRENPVEAMTYLAANLRHTFAFIDGEDFTSDTQVHNLGAVMACCAIIIDAQEQGTLVDNRPRKGQTSEVQTRLQAFKKENWDGRAIDWTKGRRP